MPTGACALVGPGVAMPLRDGLLAVCLKHSMYFQVQLFYSNLLMRVWFQQSHAVSKVTCFMDQYHHVPVTTKLEMHARYLIMLSLRAIDRMCN